MKKLYFQNCVWLTFFCIQSAIFSSESGVPTKGFIGLFVEPSAQSSLISFVPLLTECGDDAVSVGGAASLERQVRLIFPDTSLSLGQEDWLSVEREFVDKSQLAPGEMTGSERLKKLTEALANLPHPVRLFPNITYDNGDRLLRFNSRQHLVAQVPAGVLSLRSQKFVSLEDWRQTSQRIKLALTEHLKVPNILNFDEEKFWGDEIPEILSTENLKIQTEWRQPNLGIVCISWQKLSGNKITSSEIAQILSSMILPAEGAVGIFEK